MNKQIVHFTKWENPKKDWDFVVVADALQPAIEKFISLVPLDKLGERWRHDIKERTGTRWDETKRILLGRGHG